MIFKYEIETETKHENKGYCYKHSECSWYSLVYRNIFLMLCEGRISLELNSYSGVKEVIQFSANYQVNVNNTRSS